MKTFNMLLLAGVIIVGGFFLLREPADKPIDEAKKDATETITLTSGVVTKIAKDGITLHTYTSGGDEKVNTHIIETSNNLVLVDGQLMISNANEVNAYIKSLNKPIDAMFISHAHPDHWFGAHVFNAPTYALVNVKTDIEASGQGYIDYLKGLMGPANVPPKPIGITSTVSDGDEAEVDGVVMTIKEVVDAESAHSLVLDLPAYNTRIAQDMLYNGTHLVIGSKAGAEKWIDTLKAMKAESGFSTILPGHGLPGGVELYDANIAYLETAVKTITESKTATEYKTKIKTAYPTYAPDMFIDLSTGYLFPAQQ